MPQKQYCLYQGDPWKSVAVAPKGDWFAALELEDSQAPGLCRLGSTLGGAVTWVRGIRSPQVSQVLILDYTHGVLVGQEPDHSRLEMFNRRGDSFFSLSLGVRLDRCQVGFKPYQLLAREPQKHDSLLMLDLKPFRMKRLPVPIKPVHFCATPWGYIIGDDQGEILVLDGEGNPVGHAVVTTEDQGVQQITALKLVEDFTLLLATWSQSQGHFYGIDVRDLATEMAF